MLKGLIRLAKWAGLVLVILLVVLVLGLLYWGYSPLPEVPDLTAEIRKDVLDRDGRERAYTEYVPHGLLPGAPLLMVLHGAGMNGGMMRIASGYQFDVLADEKRFAVVYPDGFKGNWNDCRISIGYATRREQIDDVDFLLALVQRMAERHRIDPARVYLAGYSNGGQMVFRLGLETPDKFQGLATSGTSLTVPGNSTCPADGPTPPVLMENGTADRWNAYEGGEKILPGIPRRGPVLSALDSLHALARRNGASTDCPARLLPDSDGDLPVTRHACQRNGKDWVVLYSIEGGGHVFPQPVYRFPRMYGQSPGQFNLPQVAVEFFGL